MKKLLIMTTALAATAGAAQADITVMSWGGAYEKSQVEAYNRPFAAKTGIAVQMLAADNPAAPIKSMVESGNVTLDVADVEATDAARLCDEGLLEEIDPAAFPPAPDGTPAVDDFLPGALRNAPWPRWCSRPSTATTRTGSRTRSPPPSPISSMSRSFPASAGCARARSPISNWR